MTVKRKPHRETKPRETRSAKKSMGQQRKGVRDHGHAGSRPRGNTGTEGGKLGERREELERVLGH
jgi:hypothetical protein